MDTANSGRDLCSTWNIFLPVLALKPSWEPAVDATQGPFGDHESVEPGPLSLTAPDHLWR